MRKLLTVLSVTLLASGCTDSPDVGQDPPSMGGPIVVPGAANLTFDAGRGVMDIPNTGHEAFIAVSPDGLTILSCAHGDFRAPAHMYASTDGGATFTELDAGPAMIPAGDCEVALGPENAWSFAGKTELGVTVATTQDGGGTWIVSHVAGPPLNGGADREWLTYVGSSLLLVYQPGTQTIGSILVTRSMDFGATWSEPEEVAAPDPARPALTVGDFLLGPDGSVRIPLSREPAPQMTGSASFSFLLSADDGVSWSERAVAEAPVGAYPTAAAIAPDGSIVWAYTDGVSVVFVASFDNGTSWSSPVTIATGVTHERPWASARPDNTVDVLWLSDGAQTGTAGLAVTRLDPRAAQPVVGEAIVADVWSVEFAAIAHDASGRAHVVVTDAPKLISAEPELDEGLEGVLLLAQETMTAPRPDEPLRS